MAAIDPRLLWANQTGLDPNAPPIFSTKDLTFNKGSNGNQVGTNYGSPGQLTFQTPGWSATDQKKFNPSNFTFGGTADAPEMMIKNADKTGLMYTYTKDPTGQYWIPSQQGQLAGYDTNNASTNIAALTAVTMGLGGWLGGGAAAADAGAGAGAADAGAAGAGIDATGGAETAIGGSSYGGAGGYGAGVGAGSAPGYGGVGTSGAGAGTDAVAAPTTVTPTTGSGLFGTGMDAGDAVKLGSLAAGLLGGKKGGAGGSGAGANYSVTNPMIPLSQLQGMSGGGGGMLGGAGSMRPTMQTPNYGPNVTSPSQAMWQQYASGLFGRPQGSMPQQAGPGMLAQMPMVQGKPVARSGPYGG